MPTRYRPTSDALMHRRGLLAGGIACSALWSLRPALAQNAPPPGNVVELLGPVWRNGERLYPRQVVQTGDWLQTGPGGHLLVRLGDAALLMRQHTTLLLERGESLTTLSSVRLQQGALSIAWNSASQPNRTLRAAGLTVTTQGPAALHLELPAATPGQSRLSSGELAPDEPVSGTYACVCFGAARISTPRQRDEAQALHHIGLRVNPQGLLVREALHHHPDAEVAYLAALAGMQLPWASASPRA